MLPSLDQDWQSRINLPEGLWHLFQQQAGCDVIFIVGSGDGEDRLGAHSAVLMARSPILFQELAAGIPEAEMRLPSHSRKQFELFLRYLYTSDVEGIDDNDLEPLQILSEQFAVHNLTKVLLGKTLDNLPVSKFCTFVQQHEANLTGILECKCFDYVFKNAKEVFSSSDFKYLPRAFLKHLLCHEYLVLDEKDILQATLLWASYNCEINGLEIDGENQRKVLNDILFDIRFPLLDNDFFMNYISDTKLLTESEENQLLRFYLNPSHKDASRFPFKAMPRIAPEKEYDPDSLDSNPMILFNRQDSLHPVPSLPIIHQSEIGEKGTVRRFSQEATGWGYRGDKKDAIAFTVDRKILLNHVLVYGLRENQSMNVSMVVKNENGDELSTSQQKFDCRNIGPSPHLYEVGVENNHLSYGIELEPNHTYHVVLQITGSCGYYGKREQTRITEKGVEFQFKMSKYSTNNTTERMGQIMGFKFTVL